MSIIVPKNYKKYYEKCMTRFTLRNHVFNITALEKKYIKNKSSNIGLKVTSFILSLNCLLLLYITFIVYSLKLTCVVGKLNVVKF